ncbi:MAG: NUDIX domain-containing protein [Bacteroidota bacterium]|nr:NUDIX domain-containing protein [Bacteroidota bacterium]MDP4205836.1 NUDIX domain-containing protein [Bacteroidota bacterium]
MNEIVDKPYFFKFNVAVDCIIFGFDDEGLKLLLYKRNFEPEIGKWSLMGGFLSPEESLDKAASRVLAKITGLKNIFLEQFHTYGDVNRDTGARVISAAYYALIKISDFSQSMIDEFGAQWWPVNDYPELVFDHGVMVESALETLRSKAKNEPIGFELLPRFFTITQLRNLYEAIYQRTFDPGNFRKKILSMKLLDRLPIKDKTGSKKGAFLYEFNQNRYERFKSQGFLFEL